MADKRIRSSCHTRILFRRGYSYSERKEIYQNVKEITCIKKYRVMFNIIIVDDHLLFRESVKLLIEKEGFGTVIAEATNGLEFLNLLKVMQPDLVIMDIDLPFLNGLEATKKALKIYPDLKILILTMMSEYTNIADIKKSGAIGSILKSSGKGEFERVFRRATCKIDN